MDRQSNEPFSSVCVIGLGYVGLPTAAVLASRGLNVLGVDIDERAVALINEGKVHIIEPDLDILVNGAVATGKLRASTAPEPADAFIIAVPTPFTDGRVPDLSFIEAAVDSLAQVLKAGDLIIIESTSPVGTTEMVSEKLAAAHSDLAFPHAAGDDADIQIAHSPERVLPGKVLMELVRNDRVIGGISQRCAERAVQLYKVAVDGQCLTTTARTAELVKLTENAYRDVNIAFANEISLVCDELDIDVWETLELANHHPRVNILNPGPGVGGHCIAVDPWFIVHSAPDATPLIRSARQVNDGKPAAIADKIVAAAETFSQPVIAFLGLAYKANIDDLRESPAIEIVDRLADEVTGGFLIVEPHISALPEAFAGKHHVKLVDLDTALESADVIVLLTDHEAFKNVDETLLEGKPVFDTRGLWR